MIAALDHRDAGAAIRRLATPNALALLGDQLLGIVDTIAIGALGAAPLAALTGAAAVFMVLAVGMYAWATGVRIVGAQAIGAGESERFGTIVRSAAVVPLAIAVGAALVTIVVARPLLHAILPASAPLDAAANYLILRNLCLPIMVVSTLLIVAWATAGDSRLGLRVLIAINVIHVPLVFVLALGAGTHHPFGVTGAGISSLIAEFAGLCYALWATRRRPHYRIFSSWRVDGALIRLTAWLSWPEFVFLVLQLLPDPVAIALLAPAGTEAVAAFRALSLVNDATWSLPGSLGDAAEIIVGQRIGARDYDGAKTFMRDTLRI
ncbi:MAG TPA: MATE family efflux transporter, partial [Candidatus Elarobacter sp.]